jgi:hypothetical protein
MDQQLANSNSQCPARCEAKKISAQPSNTSYQKMRTELGIVVHTCNPNTWETEVGGS